MTRSRTPLTFRTAQIADETPRRRDTGPQQRHSLVCTTCNKRFNRRFDLTRHSSLHLPKDEQRRHFCTWPSCTYSALQKTNLTTHINAVHLQKKDHKCRVKNCERTFSDAASKIRHEKNLHGVLPARKIIRNRSPAFDEEAIYKLEGDGSDIDMDPVRSVTQSSPPLPHIRGETEEKPPRLEQVSPYTFVPEDYFDGRTTRSSSALSCLDAPPPPPSPTPSNQTSISTVMTDSSTNAMDGSSHESRRPVEIAGHRKLLLPNASRGRALSAPNIFVSDTAQRSRHSHSPIPNQTLPEHRAGNAVTSADSQVNTMTDKANDPPVSESKPQIRLPGIDELLRGPTAPVYRHYTHEPEALQFDSPGPSTPIHRTRQRGRSITHDADFSYQKIAVNDPLNVRGEYRGQLGDGSSPRKLNARPTNFAHFSPYGIQAERQRPVVGNRARARSEVSVLNPMNPVTSERSSLQWRSDLHRAHEVNSTANSTVDGNEIYPTPPRDTPPSRSSLDPLFGFLSRRPSVSSSPLDPLQLNTRLLSPTQPPGPKSRSAPDHTDREMADADPVSLGGEEETEGYFVSTIITSEPLSPLEGSRCRILRSDGRILPAKLVNKRVALPEEQARQDH